MQISKLGALIASSFQQVIEANQTAQLSDHPTTQQMLAQLRQEESGDTLG